jgi:hypothetical protein
MIVLIAELHGFTRARIAERLHPANDLTLAKGGLIGPALRMSRRFDDGLRNLALEVSDDLILQRLLLRLCLIELADGRIRIGLPLGHGTH